MATNKPMMQTEVIEDGEIDSGKTISVKEQLLEELSEKKYSTSSLTYSEFIAQAIEKVLG